MGTEQTEGLKGRRLYKSSKNKLIDGVCGGIAEFLGIDATLVRLGWVVLMFLGAWMMLPAYIVGMIIMPRDRVLPLEERSGRPPSRSKGGNVLLVIMGALLVVGGGFMLLHNFHLFPWSFWRLPLRLQRLSHWDMEVVWAVLLILLGALLVVSRRPSKGQGTSEDTVGDRRGKAFVRHTGDKMIGGVCSGLGRYFGIDPSLVRLVWVLGTIASGGIGGMGIYVLLWIVLPEEPRRNEPASSPDEMEQPEGGHEQTG